MAWPFYMSTPRGFYLVASSSPPPHSSWTSRMSLSCSCLPMFCCLVSPAFVSGPGRMTTFCGQPEEDYVCWTRSSYQTAPRPLCRWTRTGWRSPAADGTSVHSVGPLQCQQMSVPNPWSQFSACLQSWTMDSCPISDLSLTDDSSAIHLPHPNQSAQQ